MSTARDYRGEVGNLPARQADIPSTETALAITGALEGLKAIRTFVQNEFVVGRDFGKIPGCGDKNSLLNPGAQKAAMYFNCYPTYRVKENDLGGGHVDFRVRCLLMNRASKDQVGEGIGCASTREKKFKRGGGGKAKKCPYCDAPAIAKSSFKDGWYCNAKNGGCGLQFKPDDKRIADAPMGEAADDSAYEVRNTVLKMAKKRAFVDAAMTLGCLNELFTQDIVDTFGYDDLREASEVIDGEIMSAYQGEEKLVSPTLPDNRSGHGKTGTYASAEQVIAFNKWLTSFCELANKKWKQVWEKRMDEGRPVPAEIKDFLHPIQAKNHLMKWCVAAEMIDPRIIPEDVKVGQKDGLIAIPYHRSEEDRAALKAEMSRYAGEQKTLKENVIFRKNPEMAPEGWAEEQAEMLAVAKEDEGQEDPYVAPEPPKKKLTKKELAELALGRPSGEVPPIPDDDDEDWPECRQ